MLDSIDGILKSGILMMGEFTEKFENDFSNRMGVKYSVTTNTCTTALQIVLSYYNVKDREILVPSASFITDISSIKWSGGIPVFVDMNPYTMSFDLNDLEKKLTSKTKALIWVHLTGVVSDQYLEIINFCKSNNLVLIEDCSHAHGATVNNKFYLCPAFNEMILANKTIIAYPIDNDDYHPLKSSETIQEYNRYLEGH